jgi:hypothetical protein
VIYALVILAVGLAGAALILALGASLATAQLDAEGVELRGRIAALELRLARLEAAGTLGRPSPLAWAAPSSERRKV